MRMLKRRNKINGKKEKRGEGGGDCVTSKRKGRI
jgi:hypothetical protein